MTTDCYTTLSLGASLLLVTVLSAQNTTFENPVRLKADGKVIDTGADIGHAGPIFTDHDGDGLPDLLVSSFRGNIRFFKNVGTRRQPEFKEKGTLKAEGPSPEVCFFETGSQYLPVCMMLPERSRPPGGGAWLR